MSKINRTSFILIVFFILLINILLIPNFFKVNPLNENIEEPKFSTGLEGTENVLITDMYRVANISGYGLVRFEDSLTFKNLNNYPLTSIFIGIPSYLSDKLIYYKAVGTDENTLLAERSNMMMNNYEMITLFFNTPLLPQESKSIKFIQQYKEVLSYIPFEDQLISYVGVVYPILPYKMEGSVVAVFLLPTDSANLEGGWGFANPEFFFIRYDYEYIRLEIGDDFILPFLENLGDKKIVEVSFTHNDFTGMEIIELNRDIFISPWGIIRVKEDFLIQNVGTIHQTLLVLKIPRVAKGTYISDDLGEILGVTLADTGSGQFTDVIIDRTLPYENAPTRKPGIALLTDYIEGDYDLGNSFVIGDRQTDYELAKNLESYLFFNDFIALKRINNRNEWVELNELERKKITDELELYIKDSKRKKSKEKEYYVQSE